MRFAWQVQWFRGLWCRFLKPPTQNPWKGCKFHVTEVLLCKDHFAWQLQEFVCFGWTFSWQAQYFWSIHLKIAKTYIGIVRSSVWSTCHFWRKSRTKASFLSFKASFLKEVSHKSFVFELQSIFFEGSLAQKLRFWASKHLLWRKSRTKASFLIFKASFLKEVSQKSFVWQNHLNHTSVGNQITWTSSHLTSKSLESQINDNLSFESQIDWQPTHLNLNSIDNQIRSLESQINWQPTHLNPKSTDKQNQSNHTSIGNQIICKSFDNQLTWISNRLTTKSFESQLDWQPNLLNLTWIDNRLTWSSNQQTSKIIWSAIRSRTKSHLNLKSIDIQINSFESDINRLSNHLISTHPLPIGSFSLETSATASCSRYVILQLDSWLQFKDFKYLEVLVIARQRPPGLELLRPVPRGATQWFWTPARAAGEESQRVRQRFCPMVFSFSFF